MILARISRAIREQNWFAVALEFIIVIAGVVIGFQITAMNAARAERDAEREYLGRLVVDLQDASAEIQSQIAFEQEAIQLVSLALGFANEIRGDAWGSEMVPEELSAALSMLTIRRTLVINSPTYFELQSAGRLSLIRDRRLRETLISFFGTAARSEAIFLQNNEHFVDFGFNQFIREKGIAIRLRPAGLGRVPPTSLDWPDMADLLEERLHRDVSSSNPETLDRDANDAFWEALRVQLAWRANIAVVNENSAERMELERSETQAIIQAYLEAAR